MGDISKTFLYVSYEKVVWFDSVLRILAIQFNMPCEQALSFIV